MKSTKFANEQLKIKKSTYVIPLLKKTHDYLIGSSKSSASDRSPGESRFSPVCVKLWIINRFEDLPLNFLGKVGLRQ